VETPPRHVRLFDSRHRVCDDDGHHAPADAWLSWSPPTKGRRLAREAGAGRPAAGIEHVAVFLNRTAALAEEPARLDVVEAATRRLLAEFGYPADDVL
jgi:hypothetical protein